MNNFKQSIEKVLAEKEQRMHATNGLDSVSLNRLSLNDNDRKRVLEKFVESDEALGQLLDFISNQYIEKAGGVAEAQQRVAKAHKVEVKSPDLGHHQKSINVQSNDKELVVENYRSSNEFNSSKRYPENLGATNSIGGFTASNKPSMG